jgi:hypothetical protein
MALRRFSQAVFVVTGFAMSVVVGPPTACAAPPKMAKRKVDVAATDGTTAVRLVRVPNRGIQPQAAVDTEGTVHMIYLGDEPGAANVYYVRKAAGSEGDSFSKPLRVNSQPGSAIAIGSIRGAHLALGKANRVHVAWNGSGTAEPKGDAKYGNPMLYSRLAEDGTAFEPQRNVIREAYGLDGGGSVAADLDGNVYIAWHAGDGTGEINRRIWVVRSADDGESFDEEKPADSNKEGVCGCCGMKAFADRDGTLYLFYRSAREKVNRDMALLMSTNRGKSFRSEIADNWVNLNCPMSSEAFADTPEAVLAGWETDAQVFFTRIDKKKHRLSNPIAAPGAGAGRKHPALAVNGKGETLLAWDEGTGWERGGALAWQVFDERGKPTKSRGKTDGIPVWSFPAAYADADDSFVIAY